MKKELHLVQGNPKPQLAEPIRTSYNSVTRRPICSYLVICFCPLPKRGHWLTEAFGLLWSLLYAFHLTATKKNHKPYLTKLSTAIRMNTQLAIEFHHFQSTYTVSGTAQAERNGARPQVPPLCVAARCSRRHSYLPTGGLGSSSLLACLKNSSGRACFEIRPGFGNCISEKLWSPLVRRYKQLSALRIYSLSFTSGLFSIYQISFHLH